MSPTWRACLLPSLPSLSRRSCLLQCACSTSTHSCMCTQLVSVAVHQSGVNKVSKAHNPDGMPCCDTHVQLPVRTHMHDLAGIGSIAKRLSCTLMTLHTPLLCLTAEQCTHAVKTQAAKQLTRTNVGSTIVLNKIGSCYGSCAVDMTAEAVDVTAGAADITAAAFGLVDITY